MDASTSSRQQAAVDGEGELSPLEQEVLEEYAKLAGNLDNVYPYLRACTSNQD
jgi:hypothetical protein